MSAIDVAYTITGSGPALYMVHGIGSRKTTWNPLIDVLSSDFTCVAYDLRGHGESPVPPTPYSLDDLVDDLEALRAKLGHDTIHVIGHSLGGQIGPAYAHRFPQRVESVSLLSTAAGRTTDDSSRVKAVVARMRSEGIEPVLTTLVNRWYTEPFAEAHPDIIANRIEQVLTTPPEVFLSVFDVYAETEMGPWLSEVQAPCLVLTGENDPGCNPRLNTFIDKELPNSKLVILPELRHSIIVEAPGQVLEHLRPFLLRQKDRLPKQGIQPMIDRSAHPIDDPDYAQECHARLDTDGALVLSGFFTPEFVQSVRDESEGREREAFFAANTHNIWLTPPDAERSAEHIYNRQVTSSKGLLADDQVANNSALRAVYDDEAFRDFVASVVGVDSVHPYADSLSSINIHFHRDGEELGWHFDNSSFAVTTLITPPEDGGIFEYVPDLRDADAGVQNFEGVADSVDNRVNVQALTFEPGDLVLFRGRNSMHRVTPSRGDRTRILIVFAFNTEVGVGLSESAKETFYGRT